MPPTYPDTVTKRAHDRNIFPAAQVHFHTQKLTFLSAQRQTNYDVHHHPKTSSTITNIPSSVRVAAPLMKHSSSGDKSSRLVNQ